MNLCLCVVGSKQLLSWLRCVSVTGGRVTIKAWLRGCNSSIPVQAAGKLPVIADQCVHGMFNYMYQHKSLKVEATVCACHTDFCNDGNITLLKPASSTTTQSSFTGNPHPSSKLSSGTIHSDSTKNSPTKNLALIIGLSVGLGCGLLLIIIAIIITVVVACRGRRSSTSAEENVACDDSIAGPMELDDDDTCILADTKTENNAKY